MALESKVYAALATAVHLNTLVGDRIYPIKMLQGTDYPAIVYRRSGGERIQDVSGYSTLENAEIEVEVHATAITARRLVGDAVVSALSHATGFSGMMFSSPFDRYDDSIGIYTRTMEISIWNSE